MNLHIKQKLSLNNLAKALLALIIFFKSDLLFAQVTENISNIGKLTVIITGFANDNGNCRFAIDNSKYVYEREDTVWIGKVLPIVNKQVIVVIDSLEFGEYAVRVFHDENKNEKIDTNFLGIPTEDYGYSNNASSWFGPPSWEKAKFIFNKAEMTIEIEVGSFI